MRSDGVVTFSETRERRNQPKLEFEGPLRVGGDAWRIYFERGYGMVEELRFLWNATRGSRLRPWRSPYLRWRLETFTGQRAETVGARDFWNLAWGQKRQFLRFLQWTREMRGYAESEKQV